MMGIAVFYINPFTLRVPLESIICSFFTFVNNLESRESLQNVEMGVVLWLLINISPSNVFQKMLL